MGLLPLFQLGCGHRQVGTCVISPLILWAFGRCLYETTASCVALCIAGCGAARLP